MESRRKRDLTTHSPNGGKEEDVTSALSYGQNGSRGKFLYSCTRYFCFSVVLLQQ